jgi:ElaB/YqjD/DUF883 family membrane-anchored ribosome-binding protein
MMANPKTADNREFWWRVVEEHDKMKTKRNADLTMAEFAERWEAETPVSTGTLKASSGWTFQQRANAGRPSTWADERLARMEREKEEGRRHYDAPPVQQVAVQTTPTSFWDVDPAARSEFTVLNLPGELSPAAVASVRDQVQTLLDRAEARRAAETAKTEAMVKAVAEAARPAVKQTPLPGVGRRRIRVDEEE